MKTKKLILASLFVLASTTFIFAQQQSGGCVEVKGVETRRVDAEKEYEVGFEFSNLNNYEITVEAELRNSANTAVGYETVVKDTKSFVLKANEKYVWVCDRLHYYLVNGLRRQGETYVKFKAFKCP